LSDPLALWEKRASGMDDGGLDSHVGAAILRREKGVPCGRLVVEDEEERQRCRFFGQNIPRRMMGPRSGYEIREGATALGERGTFLAQVSLPG
jgi:hypothetical protein